MHLPPDILQLILEDILASWPLSEVCRTRLVNRFFAKEIQSLLSRGRGCADDWTFYRSWAKFPYKRAFLRTKIRDHALRPCAFSALAEEIFRRAREPQNKDLLDRLTRAMLGVGVERDAEKNTTEKEVVDTRMRDTITTSLIESILHSRKSVEDTFSSDYYESVLAEWYASWPPAGIAWEAVEKTLQCALATSAIVQGDATTLTRLLGAGVAVHQNSVHLGLVPLDIACQMGSEEVVRAIAMHDGPLLYVSYADTTADPPVPSRRHVLSVTVQSGNLEAMKAWVTGLRDRGVTVTAELSRAYREAMRRGDAKVLETIETWCGVETAVWRSDCLVDAVEAGELVEMQGILSRGGFDLAARTARYPEGPVFAAVHSRGYGARAKMLRILLEHGAESRYQQDGKTFVVQPDATAIEETAVGEE